MRNFFPICLLYMHKWTCGYFHWYVIKHRYVYVGLLIGPSLAEHFTPDNSFFDYLNDNIDENFTFSPVTVTEVSSLVHSFKNSSPGYDDITMKIFKDNIEILADVIIFICNLSFWSGVYPEHLMVAIITCIYKSGNPQLFHNYIEQYQF